MENRVGDGLHRLEHYVSRKSVANHDFHRVLKEIVATKGKPFKAFLLTNFVDPQQVLALKAEGFDDVIFKPLNTDKLKAFLK